MTATRHSALDQHVGDTDGRIALWLNKQSAEDLIALLHTSDLGRLELEDALERAYPSWDAEDD